MDALRFDLLARSLTKIPSRRGLLRSLAGATIGLAAMHFSGGVEAKKKRKNKQPKKLERNAFGCVDVGGKCRGSDGACCSGVCQGKKPKKGKKDRSRCVAHDVGSCQAGQDTCVEFGTACEADGSDGGCFRTTGKAGFCGFLSECAVCQKDADCEPSQGPGAACVVCAGCPETGNTLCVSAAG